MLQQLPRIAAGLAVAGVAWQATQLSSTTSAHKTPVAAHTAVTTAANAQTIAAAPLSRLPTVVNAATDPSDLSRVQMNSVLYGTIAFDDPKAGYAIVGENATNTKSYKVGAAIATNNGEALLRAVYSDRVIIERAGLLENLVLQHGPQPFATPLPRTANANFIADILARAQPVFIDGKQTGYRVYPAGDRSQSAGSGLQTGDLITVINDTPLDDPSRGASIFNAITSSNNVTMIIERNGAVQQLTLD